MTTTTEKNGNRLVILSKGRGPRFEKQFFLEIESAILEGYRFIDNDVRNDQSMRNFRGMWGKAILEKAADKPAAKVEAKKEVKTEKKEKPKAAPKPKKDTSEK